MESLDSPINRCEMVKLPVVYYYTLKLVRLQVDCSVYVASVRVIRYSQMSLWHYRLKKTAEHHTTHVAFPDLIPTQKNMRSKNNEVNKGRSS